MATGSAGVSCPYCDRRFRRRGGHAYCPHCIAEERSLPGVTCEHCGTVVPAWKGRCACGSECPTYLPTPAAIRDAMEAIQASWTPLERLDRIADDETLAIAHSELNREQAVMAHGFSSSIRRNNHKQWQAAEVA